MNPTTATSVTLVTGATGLVGNNVVRQLLQLGHRVRVLVRSTRNIQPLNGLTVDCYEGNVLDKSSVVRACQGVNNVIHAAAYVQIGGRNLEAHRAINVQGTVHVTEAARNVGARMVHVSTCDALGIGTAEHPATESTPLLAPLRVPYVITKCEAELVVRQEVARGLQAVIVNPGFMLGPWDWKPSSGRMLIEVAAGRGWFAPRGTVSLCDVRDVAAATITALHQGTIGQRYALAGVSMSYLEAWRLFAEVTGARRPICNAGPFTLRASGWAGDVWAMVSGTEPAVNSRAIALANVPKYYSSQLAAKELNYSCRDARETIYDAWMWFRSHEYLPNRKDNRFIKAPGGN